MKMALVSLNPTVGDVAKNTQKILNHIQIAIEQNCQLIVFPELSLLGYPPKDLLYYAPLYQAQMQALEKLKRASKKISILVGGVSKNLKAGAPFFNSAFLWVNGQKQVYHKQLLPHYDVFDEKRYFEPGTAPLIFKAGRLRIGVTICEDIWASDSKLSRFYSLNPLLPLRHKIDVLINLSASPFETGKFKQRETLLKNISKSLKCPVLYVNQSGANDDLIFDGSILALNAKSKIQIQEMDFQEKQVYWTADLPQLAPINPPHKFEEIQKALVTGIRDYFYKSGFKTAVLGLSGGIDSALAAHLCVLALGEENVTGVLLPSRYSSLHSLTDARLLAKNLKIKTFEVPIEDVHAPFEKTLITLFKPAPLTDITAQNIQARLRGNLLMAIANQTQSLLINTTNKSEMAFGFGTLYGDLAGALSPLSDLTKNEVYGLAKWMNPSFEFIPKNSFDKEPSAELKPHQKDSDNLPEYNLLDPFVNEFIENFSHDVQSDWALRVLNQEHKRFQAPLGLKISKKAFGSGRKIPLVQKMKF